MTIINAKISGVLLDILTLVRAGMELEKIVSEVRSLEEQGASRNDIRVWLREQRDKVLKDLKEA